MKWYGKYGRKPSWIVKWFGKYGEGKVSRIVIDMDNMEERQVEMWNDMEHMEER